VKTCFKCKVAKPLAEFYRHPYMADGHLGKCKECTKADVAENRAKRREQYSEYEKNRNGEPERRAKKLGYLKKHNEKYPEKALARQMVNNAVRDRQLKREPCVYCGDKRSQAHHSDYSKPLDVTWACFKCHREREHGQTVVSEWRGGVDPTKPNG